jgi:hypothetical protein
MTPLSLYFLSLPVLWCHIQEILCLTKFCASLPCPNMHSSSLFCLIALDLPFQCEPHSVGAGQLGLPAHTANSVGRGPVCFVPLRNPSGLNILGSGLCSSEFWFSKNHRMSAQMQKEEKTEILLEMRTDCFHTLGEQCSSRPAHCSGKGPDGFAGSPHHLQGSRLGAKVKRRVRQTACTKRDYSFPRHPGR